MTRSRRWCWWWWPLLRHCSPRPWPGAARTAASSTASAGRTSRRWRRRSRTPWPRPRCTSGRAWSPRRLGGGAVRVVVVDDAVEDEHAPFEQGETEPFGEDGDLCFLRHGPSMQAGRAGTALSLLSADLLRAARLSIRPYPAIRANALTRSTWTRCRPGTTRP